MQKEQPSSRVINTHQLGVRSKSCYPVKKVVNITLELPEKYTLVEKVGQGSFGEIYKIYDNETHTLHACKVEFKDTKQNPGHQPLLAREYKVLQALSSIQAVPQAYQFITNAEYNMILMPYFGTGNLEEIRKRQKSGCFSKKTTMLLGWSLVDALEKVHEKNYMHRDIKPENFIVGSAGFQHKVFIIDYGLAKLFVDQQGNHIPMATNKGMVGTARYTSINSHIGLEQSRRDDLEAIGYVLLYLNLGQLPWQNFTCQTRQEKFQKILEQKVKFSSNQLSIECPIELKKYFDQVKALQFDQKPDYAQIKNIFSSSLQQILLETRDPKPNCYDWCPQDCTICSLDIETCDIISNEVPKQKVSQKQTTLVTTNFTEQQRSRQQQQQLKEDDYVDDQQMFNLPESSEKIQNVFTLKTQKLKKQ